MKASLQLKRLERPGYTIDLFAPVEQEVQEKYLRAKQLKKQEPFPYWAKIWPAALAMADFLNRHPELFQHKTVLELAAGLGLPSFIAARYAKSVCCSDYMQEAVDTMSATIQHLQLSNITARLLDWNQLPDDVNTDVLLLSDINYDTTEFESLQKLIHRFLEAGTDILLTTPQRLMAKSLIEGVLPFCRQRSEMNIILQNQETTVSIFLLVRPD